MGDRATPVFFLMRRRNDALADAAVVAEASTNGQG